MSGESRSSLLDRIARLVAALLGRSPQPARAYAVVRRRQPEDVRRYDRRF